MKARYLIVALAAGFLTFQSVSANAQPMEGGWHHGEGLRILSTVNLTAPQKQKVHEIMQSAWNTAKPLMQQLHAVHADLTKQLLAPGDVTSDQLMPLVQKEEQLRSDLDEQRLNTVLAIRALLTPDQLAAAATKTTQLQQLHNQERAIWSSGKPATP